jgi:hypothetical protein
MNTTAANVTLFSKAAPSWVLAHPAYQAAMEGAALLEEPGEGLTAAEALAADRAFAAASGDIVGAAAGRGTVVAWVYGDGLADSGGLGAVDRDEVYMTAR